MAVFSTSTGRPAKNALLNILLKLNIVEIPAVRDAVNRHFCAGKKHTVLQILDVRLLVLFAKVCACTFGILKYALHMLT